MPRTFFNSRFRFVVIVPFAAALSLAAAFIFVQDAHAQTMGFASPTASVTEGDSGTVNMVFPVEFSSAPANGKFFSYSLTSGTATTPADYVDFSGGIVSFFCLGTCPTTFNLTVQIVGDTVVEPNETFTITLTSGDFPIDPARSSAVGTIIDNDLSLPNLSINDVSLSEGNAGTTSYTFTVSLSAPAGPGGVTFDIATADGTAVAPGDYTGKSLTGQTIPAGSSTYAFTVLVNGDTTPEANETFFVNVTSVTGATVTDGQGQGTVSNDDLPTLSITDVLQSEGSSGTSTFDFTVSLSSAASTNVTFDIATVDGTAQDDTPGTEDNDYVANSQTAQTIAAGSTTYTFSVTVNGDLAVESDETFFVNVTNVTGATVADAQGQGTIVNDDSNLSINDVTLAEGNSGTTAFTFTVSLSPPAGPGGVTFDIATADGTAQDDNPTSEDNDYLAQSLTGQTIAAGSSTSTFTVQVNGDTALESNETFFVNVTNVTGASVADGQGQGTIVNDEVVPNLTVSGTTQNEGNTGTTAFPFTVSLSSPANAGGVTFDIATSNGTATIADSDYVAQSLTGQTIAAGTSTYTFTVQVNGDTAFESDETFNVTVSNVTGATVATGAAQGTITNDDTAPVIPSLTVTGVSQNEGNVGPTTFNVTVSLSAPAGPGGVTFDIATSDGTATAGSDYVARSLTGQSIPAGASSYTFAVQVNGDTTVEPNETFNVTVSNVTGATVATGTAQSTITNDDGGAPLPSLSINDVAQNEGNAGTSAFTFTVSLSTPAPAGGVTFAIATADGTATAGSDYVAQTLTGQTIPAGSSSYTFTVTVNGDTVLEADETFAVNVSGVTGASVVDGQGQGTIVNDDGGVTPPPPGSGPGTVPTPTPTPPPGNGPGDDDTDKPRKETDEQRQQREHTNTSNQDDIHSEGNVIGIRLTLADPIPVVTNGFIARPDAVPYILIGTRDGVQQILLSGDAAKAARSIRVGDYVSVEGTKQSEELFEADELDISR